MDSFNEEVNRIKDLIGKVSLREQGEDDEDEKEQKRFDQWIDKFQEYTKEKKKEKAQEKNTSPDHVSLSEKEKEELVDKFLNKYKDKEFLRKRLKTQQDINKIEQLFQKWGFGKNDDEDNDDEEDRTTFEDLIYMRFTGTNLIDICGNRGCKLKVDDVEKHKGGIKIEVGEDNPNDIVGLYIVGVNTESPVQKTYRNVYIFFENDKRLKSNIVIKRIK